MQQDNELSAPVASLSNLSAPVSPLVSYPTSPGRRSAKEADLSFSDSATEDDGNPRPPRPRNGKGIYFCSLYIPFKLNKCMFSGKTVVDDDEDEAPNRRPPKKRTSAAYQYDTFLLNQLYRLEGSYHCC